MSSITFYQAVKIAAIEQQTSISKLWAEIPDDGKKQSYNYVYQVLRGQRDCTTIIEWFEKRLNLKATDYNYCAR